jgi:hypothetical protein
MESTKTPAELRAEFIADLQQRLEQTKVTEGSGYVYYFREAGMPVNFDGGKPSVCDLAMATKFPRCTGLRISKLQPMNGNGEKAALLAFEDARQLELTRLQELLKWMQDKDQHMVEQGQ